MAPSTTQSSRPRLAPLALLLLPLFAQAIVLNPHIDHSLNDAPAASASSAAASAEKRDAPVRIPLHHLTSRQHSDDLEVRQQWLKDQARGLRSKYSQYLNAEGQAQVKRDLQEIEHERAKRELAGSRLSKRANGTVQLTDVGVDASYAGTVSVGSPSQDFLLILDTGSADMWIADTDCSSSSCRSIPTFNPSSSSSLQESSTPFDITYGSGQAAGVVATDTVTMGGFTISNQGFGLVTNISSNLISNPLSGLMGLAWASIAQTGATPFWQNLASSGKWSSAEMGFYMRRWRGVRGVQTVESDGGELTLGGLDSSKYTGSVNYINFPSSNEDYWRIPVEGMTVQGNSISLSSPSAAIDTGTTLVGVPSSVIRSVYGNIQGSQSLAAYGYNGYYQYPCSTTVNIALQFGGLSYSISNQDFNLGPYTQDTSMCTGAFFQMDLSSQSPISWIVGATFLKNVYSVFRYNPPAVGFAALSDNAGAVSNGTITTTNNGGTSGSTSAAGRGAQAMSAGLVLAVAGAVAAAAW